uniref:Rh50-like protein n=1 Tax=Callorhinchus milii TaxID=7868 RepID=V9KPS5_CALMI|eukprot:gi/632939284/ref/XP_007909476.1/ PREDICTED: ammonium transporter Rh type C-like [Callorhinchus milii]
MLSARWRLPLLVVGLQVGLFVLFVLFVTYDEHSDAAGQTNLTDHAHNQLYAIFPLFQDVQVMIFVGFGLLMGFLKKYGYGGIALNFLIAVFSVQWALLVQGWFYHLHRGRIRIGIRNLLGAETACATVMISFGAVLGKTSPVQVLVLALLEVPLFTATEWLVVELLGVKDVGGSVAIHLFACYFGLSVTAVLYRPGLKGGHKDEAPDYHSDKLAMLGTLLLWVFWPSFNSAAAARGDDQHRAVLHTYIGLSSCTMTTFAISSLLDKRGKISLGHLQNAALAGGVAVGSAVDLMLTPAGAFALGSLASIFCTLGFRYLSPFLAKHLKIQDVCGINNLHGIPGFIGAIGGIVTILATPDEAYGAGLYETFPHRAPPPLQATQRGELGLARLVPALQGGAGRSAADQARSQLAGIGVCLGMAVLGGMVTGLVLKLPFLAQPEDEYCFNDDPYFQLPTEGEPKDSCKIVIKNC